VKGLKDKQLLEFVPEDVVEEIKEAAEVSMGTEILDDDEKNIKILAQ